MVEPVIGNGKCGSQLGGVEEVGGIPVVTSVTPRSGPVARSILPKQVSFLPSSTSLFSSNAHQEFCPSTIDPFSIVGHEVRVTEVLDPELGFTGGVENTRAGWAAIIDMDDDGCIEEHSSIGHNGIVPSLEIWVILHQVRQGGPFIGRSNQPRVARPEGGQGRGSLNEVILWPCLLALGAKCGLCKDRGVGLQPGPSYMSASWNDASSVTYGGRINGLHPCICAECESSVFEIEAGTAIVVAVAIAITVALAVSIRACVVALRADSKVGTNASTSKNNEG